MMTEVSVLRVDHVQLAMPAGREADAVGFYEGLLRIPLVPKPTHLAARGGCWFERGDLKIHLGVDDDFRAAIKAHPALIVDDLRQLAEAIAAAGYDVMDDEPLDGYDRVYVFDPFGNRVELMQPLTSSDLDRWDARTRDLLEDAYIAAGDGPRGAGSGHDSNGDWRAKRQHLTVPMDRDGSWLDVGCANAFLMATLPTWCAERDVTIEPYGLELLPGVADLARALHPELADRIWTGSVMRWSPPRRFTYVTAIEDQVPPHRLGDLVARLVDEFVERGGRAIISAYTNQGEVARDLFADLAACGHTPDGQIRIERPGRGPLISAWLNA